MVMLACFYLHCSETGLAGLSPQGFPMVMVYVYDAFLVLRCENLSKTKQHLSCLAAEAEGKCWPAEWQIIFSTRLSPLAWHDVCWWSHAIQLDPARIQLCCKHGPCLRCVVSSTNHGVALSSFICLLPRPLSLTVPLPFLHFSIWLYISSAGFT